MSTLNTSEWLLGQMSASSYQDYTAASGLPNEGNGVVDGAVECCKLEAMIIVQHNFDHKRGFRTSVDHDP